MIDIQYTTTPEETAAISLQFLSNRPIVAALFTAMKLICYVLFIAFAFTAYHNALRLQDVISLITAIIWLLYYKPINRWIISYTLKHRKFPYLKHQIRLDDQSILYQQNNFHPKHIAWKKLRFILKDSKGYMIPLTGITNAGQYIWLPLSSLQTSEQEFLTLVTKFRLKIKNL